MFVLIELLCHEQGLRQDPGLPWLKPQASRPGSPPQSPEPLLPTVAPSSANVRPAKALAPPPKGILRKPNTSGLQPHVSESGRRIVSGTVGAPQEAMEVDDVDDLSVDVFDIPLVRIHLHSQASCVKRIQTCSSAFV